MNEQAQPLFDKKATDIAAFMLSIVVLTYAASGPIGEFVKWFIEVTTPGFDELSRRDKRLLFKTHWLGQSYRMFEQGVLLPTGMILGLPVLLGFLTVSLNLHRNSLVKWGLSLAILG